MGIDGDDKLFEIRNIFNATKLCTYKWLTKINIMLYIWYPNIKKIDLTDLTIKRFIVYRMWRQFLQDNKL